MSDFRAVFFYFMLPEMKGLMLEEIDELFEKKVPTRQFATFVCTIHEQAHNLAMKKSSVDVTQVEGIDKRINEG